MNETPFLLQLKFYKTPQTTCPYLPNKKELDHMKELKNSSNIKPIFIVGVPRCGSTLVEKIIGSGKNYIPSGEEIGVIGSYVIAKVLEKESLNLGSSEEVANELFNIYKNRGLVYEKYNYIFTDKSLDNFFYLKLIKEIYPNAKLVHCKRNLFSSIVSIFQNNYINL